jgi:purine-binding chemotaxis protein CheW
MQLVGFKTGGEFFGVPIGKVKEIVKVPEITSIPDTPDFLHGIMNLRGRLVPVMDLGRRLAVGSEGKNKSRRVLVLELDGSLVGLLVDSASEILKVREDQIEPTPGLISAFGAEYVTGVGKLKDKLIVLLDISRLLSAEDLLRLSEGLSSAAEGKRPEEGLTAGAS